MHLDSRSNNAQPYGRFLPYSKSLSPKAVGERLFASKRRAELGRGRRRRIYINVRLRFCLRRWRFFYDRGVGFLLLGWRIRHRSFLVLTTHKQCGPRKDEKVFFHNGREFRCKTIKALVAWQATRRSPPDFQWLLPDWWQLDLPPAR